MNNSSIESDVYLTQPLEIGTIDIEPHVPEGNAVTFYYDDLAVCGLNAPLIPKTTPTPEGWRFLKIGPISITGIFKGDVCARTDIMWSSEYFEDHLFINNWGVPFH